VRIGTWNLAGRWSPAHAGLLESLDCDAWLLTEVRADIRLPGWTLRVTEMEMVPGRAWAGVLTREPSTACPDPHPASAMAVAGGVTFVSSVLPWRNSDGDPPWVGADTSERTVSAVSDLVRHLAPSALVWGGDWNHELTGRLYAGTRAGRAAILAALDRLDLYAPTATLEAATTGGTIDHIAIGSTLEASARQVSTAHSGQRLSDHDAYLVQIDC